ncbi:MAG: HEAT repeat domain-containing protein [Acidobacteriota bacterium]
MSQIDRDNGEQAPVGVFTTDTEMIVRVWDAALQVMTGVSADAAVGRPLTEVISDLESRGLLATFELVLSEGTTEVLAPAFHKFLIRCPARRPNAYFNEVRQLVTISALREDEQIRGLAVVVEDVTERMILELAARLRDADDAVRLEAAKALSKGSDTITGEEAEPIINALADKNWRVRRKLVESLSRRSAPEVMTALLAAVREEHLDFGILNSALQILRASSVDTTETLIDFLKTGDADLRMQAALALGQHPGNAAAIAGLIDALDDENTNVRYHAIEGLGKLRAADAVEPLAVIAESRDPFLSFAALEALKEIGDVAVAPRVVPLLEDHFLSEAAVGTLGVTGGPETVDAIVGLLNDGGISASAATTALAALYDRYDSSSDGEQIAERLRRAVRPGGISALLTAIDGSDAGSASVTIAGWIDDPNVREKLALLAADDETREAAVKALVSQGDAAVPYFVGMLYSHDPGVRRAAVRSLGKIGSEQSVGVLLNELRSDSENAPAAAQALGMTGSIAAFDGLIDALSAGDKALQRSAVNALKSLDNPEKENRLLDLNIDAEPNVREAVIRIIGGLNSEKSRSAILAGCTDPSEPVRIAAIEQLAVLDADDAIPVLAQSVKDDSPKVRAAAVQTLGKFESGESAAALRSALGDEDAWTRYFAVRSLAELNDVESRDEIRRLSESDDAEQVRAAAAEAMARL